MRVSLANQDGRRPVRRSTVRHTDDRNCNWACPPVLAGRRTPREPRNSRKRAELPARQNWWVAKTKKRCWKWRRL